jgi:hypothetical protein
MRAAADHQTRDQMAFDEKLASGIRAHLGKRSGVSVVEPEGLATVADHLQRRPPVSKSPGRQGGAVAA